MKVIMLLMEFRWETTGAGTTQLQRLRLLGQGHLFYAARDPACDYNHDW